MDSAEVRSKVAKLGLAAVLAYGLFDGVAYNIFCARFPWVRESTGKNPAANLYLTRSPTALSRMNNPSFPLWTYYQHLKMERSSNFEFDNIVILMWTGNNVTRPFRVAGAAALAPLIDKGLKKIQKKLNLPSQVYAFALVVTIVAASCLTIAGMLILSRWGK